MTLQTINPTNNKLINTYKLDSEKRVFNKLQQASYAWNDWRKTSFLERKNLMLQVAAILREEQTELAELMAIEMGKPISDGVGEIEKCAKVCEYYTNSSENILKDDFVETEASKSYVSYQPLGVVLAIMPWNFPFWQCFRFLAPALMAGNCCVLKHASNVPGCALAIERIITKAGFPTNDYLCKSEKNIVRLIGG
jgi:succinate-semialdehyde dehydrogenase/glutarate-semialdehyde dehydrogenase